MTEHSLDQASASQQSHRLRYETLFVALVFLQAVLYGLVTGWSRHFAYDSPLESRPIPVILGLLSLGFLLHLLSLIVGLRLRDVRTVTIIVVVAAIGYRLILLWSEPIQEVDLYRYLWDGAVVAEGVNPFRYSPEQVRRADAEQLLADDLRRLVDLRDRSGEMAVISSRVHFGELTTVYPPVSQAVFALGTLLTPPAASIPERIVVFKLLLITFDVATIGLLLALLKLTQRHPAWSMVYAWSPLVLKEIANSGHLDAIAVCFTTAAVYSWSRGLLAAHPSHAPKWLMGSAFLLGLAVASKLYPIVLLPLVTIVISTRVSVHAAFSYAGCALFTSVLLLTPMFATRPAETAWTILPEIAITDSSSVPAIEASQELPSKPSRPSNGLAMFLQRWEINDLIFMVILENLQPNGDALAAEPLEPRAWFAIVPDIWRQAIIKPLAAKFEMTPEQAGFVLARGVTVGLFFLVAGYLAWKARISTDVNRWLELVFLTVAWFWALSPTLNPWYWSWALPFLPFVRRRAWMIVSGLVPLYYVRFWLTYQLSDEAILGTPYRGENFFHFVVVPIEHGIWMVWLFVEWWKCSQCGASYRTPENPPVDSSLLIVGNAILGAGIQVASLSSETNHDGES